MVSENVDKKARLLQHRLEVSVAKRSEWANQNVKYIRMYNGDQWTQEERSFLEKHKRFPLTINICAPIIDGFVSMLAANSPRYRAVPANEAGKELAMIAEFLLEYNCYISHFPEEFVAAMYDYAISGIGWMMADVDPLMDLGAGEVVNRSIRWPDVHWDWRARRPGLRDREWTMVFRELAAGKLKAMYPKHTAIINAATKRDFNLLADDSRKILVRSSSDSKIILLGDIERGDDFEGDAKLLPVIWNFEIVYKRAMCVYDPAKGYEEYLSQEDFGKAPMPDLVRKESFEVVIPRVQKTVAIAGYKVLEDDTLDISTIPVIPYVKMSTGSAYPCGIMARLEDVQYEQNKRRIAIIENAMACAAGRMLAPRGAIERDEWETWGRVPGGLVEYTTGMDLQREAFIQLQPQSLPNQFFYLDQTTIQLAEYISGVDSLFLGSTRNMPETYRQSLMVEEYGRRKIRAIDLSAIETSLEQLGQVTLELDQWWYDGTKTLSIVDDEGKIRSEVINRAVVDPETKTVSGSLNDIRKMKFSVRIVPGSTMPTNRYAVLELYLGLFDRGLLDDETVLEKTDVIDVEKVLNRVSRVRIAMQAMEDMEDTLKRQEAIIQNLENQLIQLRIKGKADEYANVLQLATLQRQMQERLSKALVDLSARQFVDNLKREERYLSQLANVRVRNLVDVARANIRASGAQARTTPSRKG